MKAAMIVDAEKVEVQARPDPTPQDDWVVVRVDAAAICGSDLHGLYHTPGGHSWIPGHEGAGTVVAVDRPRAVKVGDRVCMTPVTPCSRCDMCLAGYTIYCTQSAGCLGFGLDGMHAEYVRISERALLPIPDDVTMEQACLLLDPVGTPYHSHRRIGTNSSHVVGVFGLGPMGLGGVLNAVDLGARVIAIDPVGYRRDLAASLGAAITLDPTTEDVPAAVRQATGGLGLDRVLECSARPEALHMALDLVRRFGHVAIIGEQPEAKIRPSDHFLRKEITLSGSTCFPLGEFGDIVRRVQRGLAPERLITHRFPFAEAAAAYATFAAGRTGKVILTQS